MRPLITVPRGFPAHPRALHCQPSAIAQRQFFPLRRAVRWSSSQKENKSDDNEGHRNNANAEFSGNSSGSWTSGGTLIASALAAGVGYAYAVTSRPSQPQNLKEPQYGSAKDFEKVW